MKKRGEKKDPQTKRNENTTCHLPLTYRPSAFASFSLSRSQLVSSSACRNQGKGKGKSPEDGRWQQHTSKQSKQQYCLHLGETNQVANRPPSIYVKAGDALVLDDTFHLHFYSLFSSSSLCYPLHDARCCCCCCGKLVTQAIHLHISLVNLFPALFLPHSPSFLSNRLFWGLLLLRFSDAGDVDYLVHA